MEAGAEYMGKSRYCQYFMGFLLVGSDLLFRCFACSFWVYYNDVSLFSGDELSRFESVAFGMGMMYCFEFVMSLILGNAMWCPLHFLNSFAAIFTGSFYYFIGC